MVNMPVRSSEYLREHALARIDAGAGVHSVALTNVGVSIGVEVACVVTETEAIAVE